MDDTPAAHVHDSGTVHAHTALDRGRLWTAALRATVGSLERWRAHGLDHVHYWPACTLHPDPRTTP
jgi:hypothetical protein